MCIFSIHNNKDKFKRIFKIIPASKLCINLDFRVVVMGN